MLNFSINFNTGFPSGISCASSSDNELEGLERFFDVIVETLIKTGSKFLFFFCWVDVPRKGPEIRAEHFRTRLEIL